MGVCPATCLNVSMLNCQQGNKVYTLRIKLRAYFSSLISNFTAKGKIHVYRDTQKDKREKTRTTFQTSKPPMRVFKNRGLNCGWDPLTSLEELAQQSNWKEKELFGTIFPSVQPHRPRVQQVESTTDTAPTHTHTESDT